MLVLRLRRVCRLHLEVGLLTLVDLLNTRRVPSGPWRRILRKDPGTLIDAMMRMRHVRVCCRYLDFERICDACGEKYQRN